MAENGVGGASPLHNVVRHALSASVSSSDDNEISGDKQDDIDGPVSLGARPLTEQALGNANLASSTSRWDAYDLSQPEAVSPVMSHTASEVSDRLSTISGLTSYFPKHPQNIRPAPAYVASLGASQVVSENKAALGRRWSDEEDDENGARKSDVQFSQPALALINTFLDQLLYSFLASASSTRLNALRSAVTEVLKSKLARESIASAEEELAELLAGGDDEEEMETRHKAAEHDRKWDLELVWKRTRLRVMVYTRLGEMEDEDEERYVQEEGLFHGNEQRFAQSTGLVSWASAIFLTSVIEYIAEQTLQIAGKAAFTRARRKERSQPTIISETANAPTSLTNVLVEEYDVEKVALNSTLGRLWRTWRKAQRNSMNPASLVAHSRNVSNNSNKRSSFATANEGSVRSLHSSHPSTATMPEGLFSGVQSPGPEIDYPEHVLAANIPLPMVGGRRDVDEIETPWLARDPDAEELTPTVSSSARRNTYTGLSLPSPDVGDPFIMSSFESSTPATEQRPQLQRQRSRSVPTIPGAAISSVNQDAMPGAATTSNDEDVMPGSFPVESEQAANPTAAESLALDSSQFNQSINERTKGDLRSTTTENLSESAAAPNSIDGAPAVASQTKPEESETQSGGMVAAAAAAAVAAVGAGAAVIGFGAKEEDAVSGEDSGSKDVAETPADITQPNGEPVVTAATPVEPHGMDERKSLADIKSLIAAKPAPAPSGDVSPPSPSSRRLSSYTKETRPLSYGSVSSLGSKEQSFHSISGRRESGVSAIDATEVQVRPPSKATARSNRLVIGTSPPPSPGRDSGANRGHRMSASIDDETEKIASRGMPSPNEQTRFAHRQTPSARSNGPGKSSEDAGRPSIALSAASGTSRQDPSAAQEPGSPRKSRLTGMMKSKQSPSPEPPITSLTSASIRGPEDFDMFVQAVETVKYTLTPDNVRDDTERPRSRDVPMLSAASSSNKKQQPLPPLDTRSGRAVSSKHPASAVVPATAPAVKQEVERSVSRPAPRNARSTSRSGHQAREPRVQTESTRDFADFIRSTGPDKAPTVYPMLSNPSATSLHSLRTAHINGASATASAAASAAASRSGSPGPHDRASSMGTSRSFGGASKAPPLPPIPAQNRKSTTMQARDATASTTRNSELIDFIRSGPDERGKHRIPRNVAPFRTTMDSDQFRELAERESMDQHNDAPFGTAGSSAMSVQTTSSVKGNSARTSVNSRSALLNSSGGAGTAAPAVQQPARNTSTLRTLETNSNDPPRTRVRNKDPYSTDFVDEDDDDEEQEEVDQLAALPGKGQQQESLIDFLRNSEPPTASSSSSAAGPSTTAGGRPISSATTPRPTSIHASRSGAATPTGPTAPVDPSGRSRTMPASPRSASMRSSNPGVSNAPSSARGGARMEARSPVGGIAGGDGRRESRLSSLNSAAGGAGAGARGAANRTETADLADFLKNSGPVEDPDSAPAPSIGKAPKLSPKEAEKLRKREEKLRAKENRKASRPASAASGGSGGGFFSGFSMRRKTHLEVS